MSESIECSCYKLPRRADGLPWHVSDCPNGTTEDRVRTVREAYQATMRANEDGLPWTNPWAAVVAALDVHDEPRTKALAEVATKLGYELGRKEALAEVAAAISNQAKVTQRIDPRERSGVREGMVVAWIAAEKLAQDMASQPNHAASTGLAASTWHSDLPEDAKGPEGLAGGGE